MAGRLAVIQPETPTRRVRCPGCRAWFPDIEGPVHRYLEAVPGCWKLYGELLAREYTDREAWSSHRLTVDSYAAQHPGQPSPQTIQSVGGHLICLGLMLERGSKAQFATRMLGRAVSSGVRFRWLEPPENPGTTTVVDVVAAPTVAEHHRLARAWAEEVWQAWSGHHATVWGWIEQLAE